MGIGILLASQDKLPLVGTFDPSQGGEHRSVSRRQDLTEVKDWPRSGSKG
jgi:hypothetical protein